MTKERLMIFTIAIAATVGAIFCWYYYRNKSISHKETVPAILETEDVNEDMVDPIKLDSFDVARYLTVEKVVRTQTEMEDGTVETQYDSYLLSDIDMKNGVDETTDYSDASVGDGFEIEQGRATSFESEFGFDYKELDETGFYEKLLSVTGINGSLVNVSFDEDTNELIGQKIYVLNDKCDVIDNLMMNVSYDELLSSAVSYQTKEDVDGVIIPDYFTAVVQYRVNGMTVTKNLFLQVTINMETEVLDEVEE